MRQAARVMLRRSLRRGPSNMRISPGSVSGEGASWMLWVIDPAALVEGRARRNALLGSSFQWSNPAQDAETPSDRGSAGGRLSLFDHRNALDRRATGEDALLPPSPAMGTERRNVWCRSLAASDRAAVDARSLSRVRRDAAGRGPCRDASQRTGWQRQLMRRVAYCGYRPYWHQRHARSRRWRDEPDRWSRIAGCAIRFK